MLGVAEPGEEMDAISKDINRVIRQILNEDHKNEEAQGEALRVAIRRAVNSRLGKKPLTEVHLIQV